MILAVAYYLALLTPILTVTNTLPLSTKATMSIEKKRSVKNLIGTPPPYTCCERSCEQLINVHIQNLIISEAWIGS